MGGNVTVVEKQVVENAIAIGGSAIVQPNGRVTQTAIAIGGNIILKQGARVDGDAYAIGGKVVLAEGATIILNFEFGAYPCGEASYVQRLVEKRCDASHPVEG